MLMKQIVLTDGRVFEIGTAVGLPQGGNANIDCIECIVTYRIWVSGRVHLQFPCSNVVVARSVHCSDFGKPESQGELPEPKTETEP